ncbi:MAG TPA: glutathione S-transferase family protein [Kofleriaceae bacterium]|nr:glutathione S-transferase family protein [Kofleriaceae bacterium]
MNKIVLFGPAPSSYVRTARMVCVEKGLEHALEPLELGSAAHLKVHPWGKVPAMRHGDVQLIETSAIARYVDEVGPGPSLLPDTAAARAVMEQWISTINCYLYDSLVRNYALKYILPSFRGAAPDPQEIAAGVPAMQRDVARLDAAYAGRPFLAGDKLSLADLFVAPIVQTVSMFPEGKAAIAQAPELARVQATLESRASFVQAHAGLFGRAK